MTIILRKVRGISGLTALMRPLAGPSFGAGAGPGAVFGFLWSPLVLGLLAIAFLVAWMLAGPSTELHTFVLATPSLMVLKEKRQKRSKAIADARALIDKAEAEKQRALTPEEEKQYNDFFAEGTRLKAEIDREERLIEEERELATAREKDKAADPATPAAPDARTNPRATPEYRSAYDKLLRFGRDGLSDDEKRALSVGTDTAGGYLTAPEQMVTELIKAIDNVVHVRLLATKIPVPTAQSLGAPALDTDPDDADWTSEIKTGNEDSAMAFGKRKLEPHPLAKRIKISNDFLRMATIGGEQLVRERLAYKFGVSQEKGFLTANGVGRPLGAFVASANGISTGRDVSTGNTTTSPTFDGLISAKYTLKGQYWNEAEWMFHRDVLALIAKLKDGNGQYIWRESVRAGEPDRVLNLPVAMSEYAPNTMTTGLYAGILAAWRFYWIADALDLSIKRLDELYAETNQTGFIGRMNLDGMPVLEEAFVRVKLA